MNFESRVRSVQVVIGRARSVFLVANLATLIALAALFNTYGSWLRHIPDRKGLDGVKREAFIHAQARDLMVVSVPIVGLKFFAGDLGLVSSGGMLIVAVWMYYAFRREQHSVARVILEVAERKENTKAFTLAPRPGMAEQAQFLWAELSTAFVFVTTDQDRAVGDDRDERYPGAGPRAVVWAKTALLYGPAWTVLLCALLDCISLARPSVIAKNVSISLWAQLTEWQQAEAAARLLLALVMFTVVVKIIWRTSYFIDWTNHFYRALSAFADPQSGGTPPGG